MLGIIVGIILAGYAIVGAAEGEWVDRGFGFALLYGAIVSAVLVAVGVIFTKTAGVATSFAASGAVIAAIVAWVNGGGGIGFALLLQAAIYWAATALLGAIATAKGDPAVRLS